VLNLPSSLRIGAQKQPPAIAIDLVEAKTNPANELPASAQGQVVSVETNEDECVIPESAQPTMDTVNETETAKHP